MSGLPVYGSSKEEGFAQVSEPGEANMKTTILFVSLMCGTYLSAGVIQTARISYACASPEDNWAEYFGEEISHQHVGSAMASPSLDVLMALCGGTPNPFAWVQGLNFDVDGGGSRGYAFADAEIHGGAWFVISGGVGSGLAYFNYQVAPLVPQNEAWARTNAGPLASSSFFEPVGPFEFRFGVAFLLTVDAWAHCESPPTGAMSGYFYGLDHVTALDGSLLPNARLNESQDIIPEPSLAPLVLLALSVGWFVRRRRRVTA